jgi:hypothetical protein
LQILEIRGYTSGSREVCEKGCELGFYFLAFRREVFGEIFAALKVYGGREGDYTVLVQYIVVRKEYTDCRRQILEACPLQGVLLHRATRRVSFDRGVLFE